MSAIDHIASAQNRRDEVPNQELARELAENGDREGIREIAANLWNGDPDVQSDCIKVLYEIGYLNPELIAGYTGDFLKLLKSKQNRLVWGAMIALSTVAAIQSGEIARHSEDIQRAIEQGSVITKDNGVKVLATVAAQREEQRSQIFPYLLKHLETCRPKDVPQHAEAVLVAVDAGNKTGFIRVLDGRMVDANG